MRRLSPVARRRFERFRNNRRGWWSLWLFLILFGLAKFTDAEAQTIQPWVANSPFLGWLYAVTSVQGASNLIGVIEIAIGA